MGQLHYGNDIFDMEDQTLLHLQTVIAQKLRRRERFMLTFDSTIRGVAANCSIWVSDNAEISFTYAGSCRARLDDDFLAQLMRASYSAAGMDLGLFPNALQ